MLPSSPPNRATPSGPSTPSQEPFFFFSLLLRSAPQAVHACTREAQVYQPPATTTTNQQHSTTTHHTLCLYPALPSRPTGQQPSSQILPSISNRVGFFRYTRRQLVAVFYSSARRGAAHLLRRVSSFPRITKGSRSLTPPGPVLPGESDCVVGSVRHQRE